MSRRPMPATPRLTLAMSLLALVVALSGTAVAAGLAANSVGTKQLKKAAVTTKKIKKKAVRTATIKDGAVTGAKIADGSVGAADLAPGLLPAAPVTISHVVPEGTALPTVTVGGTSFKPACLVEPGAKIAQIEIVPAVAGATLDISGNKVAREGATRFVEPIVGSGPNRFESAVATVDSLAVTTFEGVVRSGAGAWLRVSIGLRANLTDANCTLRAVDSVLG
jgi:hypothetical protein